MSTNNHDKNKGKKRKGVWAEIETFEDPESGLAAIITERVRGAPAFSFQIVHLDDRGANKFLQVPCTGTVDIEHVVYSLAKRAREYITEKLEEAKMRPANDDKKGKPKARRGGRRGKPDSDKKPRGGLSTLARADAEAKGKGSEFVGPTRRRREKKQGKKSA